MLVNKRLENQRIRELGVARRRERERMQEFGGRGIFSNTKISTKRKFASLVNSVNTRIKFPTNRACRIRYRKYILKGKIAKVISFTFNFILLVCPPSKKEKKREIEE